VTKAVPKLIAMFIPGAGFVSAIMSVYDIVMVFYQKISKIIAVVTAFINSIVAIAAGQIGAAASRVEKILAGLLSLAISFLMQFAGLGKVADKIMGVINKVRAMVDKAIDWLIGWIVKAAKGLFGLAKAGVKKLISWWKAKTTFSAGGESHSLFFQGEGPSAKLVVASAVQSVESFLKEKAASAKGDTAKEAAIGEVNRLIKEVDKITPKSKDKEDDPDLQKKIEGLMNQIGQQLVLLLSEDEWGTEKNPSPFDYPKRQAGAYPTFYLATGTLRTLSQADMATAFGKQKGAPKGDWVYQYRATAPAPAPDKSQSLGLTTSSQIQVGKKILFDDKGTRGGGVGAFKSLVAKFGFVASQSGWDVDHVVELQLGGQDTWTNLWPLPAGENRSSGSIIKNAVIVIPKKKQSKAVKEAMQEKKTGPKPQPGLWLLIKSTRQL